MLTKQLRPLSAAPNLTELAAAKFVERHGRGGLAILEERAELAEQLGHKLAATTWRTMAAAAARLLQAEPPVASPSGHPVASRRTMAAIGQRTLSRH